MATQPHSRYYTYIRGIAQNKAFRSYSPYIFSVMTITILVMFAIRPTISTISNLQKDIDNHQRVLEAINKKAQDLTEANKNYNKISKDSLDKINVAVPTQAEISTLVRSLEQALPKQSSASAVQIQPVTLVDISKDPTTKAVLDIVKFTYNFEGNFDELINILKNLSKSDRLISIDSISLSKQETGSLIISISGKAYYLR